MAHDRLFVHLHLEGDHDEALEAQLNALVEAGQPVVHIHVAHARADRPGVLPLGGRHRRSPAR